MALGKPKESVKDFRAVVKIAPNDKDAAAKLKACEQVVKRLAFEAAIVCEDATSQPKCETLDADTIAVEQAYEGPHLREEGVTVDFVKQMIAHMKDQKKIHRRYVVTILKAAYKHLRGLQTIQDLSIPESDKFTVCGDTHGQFYDLLHIFELNGFPSEDNPYLFNGDFVDRGSFSLEVVLTLLAFVVACPKGMFLTRGNHETLNMNKMYGFDGEVTAKYNQTVLDMFREVFLQLPLAAVIESKVFVCHGGLFSRDNVTLDELRAIDRYHEPPDEGLMTEMLWSDPQPGFGRAPSKRGVGVQFGQDVTENFLETNNLKLVVRSHECKPDGYQVLHEGKCITVFSAPNYCDQMGNKGAYIVFDKSIEPKICMFSESPHPDIKPMAYATGFPSSMMM